MNVRLKVRYTETYDVEEAGNGISRKAVVPGSAVVIDACVRLRAGLPQLLGLARAMQVLHTAALAIRPLRGLRVPLVRGVEVLVDSADEC
jgi:hypothetical protein